MSAALESDEAYDFLFKIVLIGDAGVGKTCVVQRFKSGIFVERQGNTIGVDFTMRTLDIQGKRVKLQIWDTAGQERYRTITTAYYRGAMGFLLMYDITNQESFNAVQDWATQIKTYSWDNAQVILVGNKCDLEEDRVLPSEEGRRLADELGFEFFEASAKDNVNVKQVFERLVDIICVKMSESLDADPTLVGNNKDTSLVENPPQDRGCPC
uniref:Synaptic vesicle specific GTP-binding protein n=1 Tax=Callorhinchus milii TaxID=7868 RepID=V9KH02_CALMI